MSVIYIVSALGFGDHYEGFEAICAFTLRSDAERWIADAKAQDAIDFGDTKFEYEIREVWFNKSHAEFHKS